MYQTRAGVVLYTRWSFSLFPKFVFSIFFPICTNRYYSILLKWSWFPPPDCFAKNWVCLYWLNFRCEATLLYLILLPSYLRGWESLFQQGQSRGRYLHSVLPWWALPCCDSLWLIDSLWVEWRVPTRFAVCSNRSSLCNGPCKWSSTTCSD